MKTIFLTIFVCFLFVQISQAQWEPDVRLTNDPASSGSDSYPNVKCIASSGDTVHVVWQDNRDGASNEIYYKRSTDGGLSWGSDTRISNNIYYSRAPSISVSGSDVLVVWSDNRDGNFEIYYNRSADGGSSWGTDTRLTNDPAESESPSVSVSGPLVLAVWDDYRDGGHLKTYYKRSTDGGISWGTDTKLTDELGGGPSVSVSGSLVHIVWNALGKTSYKRSTDGGLNWEANILLTIDTVITNWPSLSVSGSSVNVIWLDSRNNLKYEIYYKHSTDGGITWEADTRLTTNYTSFTLFSSLAVSGSVVHVVWDDNRDGNYEIYYKRSTDGGISWGTDTRLTNNAAVSMHPFITSSSSAVHVIWFDNRDGNYEIYYKRNPTGNVTGIENIGSELLEKFNLKQNYPNPFNPSTSIQYAISNRQFVSLKVYDVLGNEIATLVNEEKPAGNYEVNFNALRLSSGIYFYKLQAGSFVETKKMILMR